MSERVHRVAVRKVAPIRTVLHENSRGIQAVRLDYTKRSKVIFVKENYVFRVLSIRIEKKVNYFYEVTTSD